MRNSLGFAVLVSPRFAAMRYVVLKLHFDSRRGVSKRQSKDIPVSAKATAAPPALSGTSHECIGSDPAALKKTQHQTNNAGCGEDFKLRLPPL